jgi:SAM-dependent methyltransferase
MLQDKQKEIEFFDAHAAADDYDVFTPVAKARLIDAAVRLLALPCGARIADLGCGSGAFTHLLRQGGYDSVGVDISPKLLAVGRAKYPGLELVEGDVENLPFPDGSLDGALLSGVVHHFPDPRKFASEVFRALRPGGKFVAFDPNRMNPFMYLYRDRSSPFYSPVGVTENERPILAGEVAEMFRQAGFAVATEYLGGLAYRYVASVQTRAFLPVYNMIDAALARLNFLRRIRPFVLTCGVKP